ncbi:putative pyridoxal phosphate-dependent aminotransferase EpsN [compost metagenome]
MSGTLGGFGAFSFNGNKIITTSGGGMLVSNNVESLNKARFLATQAKDKAVHYQHSQLGYNYRLSNISAGIGRAQLQVLNSRVQRKREIFNLYQEKLSTVPGINFMLEASYGVSTRWLTTLEISQKECGISVNDLVVYLEESNIESRPVWKPLHLQPIFTGTDYFKHNSDIDISAEIFREGICVPSGTNMTNEDQCLVINQILNFLN